MNRTRTRKTLVGRSRPYGCQPNRPGLIVLPVFARHRSTEFRAARSKHVGGMPLSADPFQSAVEACGQSGRFRRRRAPGPHNPSSPPSAAHRVAKSASKHRSCDRPTDSDRNHGQDSSCASTSGRHAKASIPRVRNPIAEFAGLVSACYRDQRYLRARVCCQGACPESPTDRKSTRLNSSHT